MPYIGQGLQQGRRQLHTFTATASQTTFSASYSPGYVDVYQNGILLAPSDYTATNGTTVVLAVGASVNDEITIIAQHLFSVADVVSASQGGTFAGDVTMTGNLTVQGTTITVDTSTAQTLAMGDADKISLGDDGDLQIYHDGNHSIIEDSGTGNLNITSNYTNIYGAGGTSATFYPGNSVDLYYNNVKKFETSSTDTIFHGTGAEGIRLNVTGQTYHHKIRSNGDGLLLSADDDDTGGAGADIRFRVANDEKMRINHDGNVGIGTTSPGTRLQVAGTQNTPSSTSKGMLLIRADGSTHGLQMGVTGSSPWGSWIQAQDNNISAPYPLTLQPGGGNVGIGTTNPIGDLSIVDTATNTGMEIQAEIVTDTNRITNFDRVESAYKKFRLDASEQQFYISGAEKMRVTGDSGLKVTSDTGNSSTQDNISIVYNGTAGGHQSGYLFRDKRDAVNAAVKNDLQDDGVGTAAAHLRFQTSHAGTLTTQMTIDRYGQVMTPNQPSFRAYSASDYTANGVLESANWIEQHDNNNDFSNGRFTAPVDGVYLFEVYWDSYQSLGGLHLLVNTSSYYVKWEPTGNTNNGWETKHYSTIIKLSSGDYVRLVGAHASGNNPFHMGSGHWGFYAGYLLG